MGTCSWKYILSVPISRFTPTVMSTRWIHEGQEYFQMLTCIIVSGDSETVLISSLSLIYKQVCTCVSVSLIIVYLVKIHTRLQLATLKLQRSGWHCLWQMVHMCVLCVLLSAKNHRTCTEYWLISMQLHREVQRGNKYVLNKYVSIVGMTIGTLP